MNYTLATVEEAQVGFSASLNKDGNRYYITICDSKAKERGERYCWNKWYDFHTDAADMFLRIAGWIVTGCYSTEERVKMMMEG